MNLRNLIGRVEKFSPLGLALAGDSVGIQVGPLDPAIQERTRIRRCAVAVDASPQVILRAASSGANLLITYHNLLRNPVSTLTDGLLDRVRLLIENKVFLYAVHTSWLSAECGLNDTLADILGLVVSEPFIFDYGGKESPIGRICSFVQNVEKRREEANNTVHLSDLITRIVERLRSNDIVYVGGLHNSVNRIALIASELGKPAILRIGRIKSVDTYLTGNVSRDLAALSVELGLSYVCANQHVMEDLGMRRLMQLLGVDAPEVEFSYIESQCPWKAYTYPHTLSKRDDESGKT